MTQEQLEQAARELYEGSNMAEVKQEAFIAGATSPAAKEYWEQQGWEKEFRIESIAYNNWVGTLNKQGFPKNEDGTMMDCWQLYDYYVAEKEKRDVFTHHAKIFDSTISPQNLTNKN